MSEVARIATYGHNVELIPYLNGVFRHVDNRSKKTTGLKLTTNRSATILVLAGLYISAMVTAEETPPFVSLK